jgi:hypothetical protein
MTTMFNCDTDDKSIQSFHVPLEIVREDPKHEQHHYSSTSSYGGDLLLTVTYKRTIVKVILLSSYRNKINSCVIYRNDM